MLFAKVYFLFMSVGLIRVCQPSFVKNQKRFNADISGVQCFWAQFSTPSKQVLLTSCYKADLRSSPMKSSSQEKQYVRQKPDPALAAWLQ